MNPNFGSCSLSRFRVMNNFRCARKVFRRRCRCIPIKGVLVPHSRESRFRSVTFSNRSQPREGGGNRLRPLFPTAALSRCGGCERFPSPLSAIRSPFRSLLAPAAAAAAAPNGIFSRVGTPKWNAGPCYNPGIDVGGKREIPHVRIPERARIEFFALLEYLGRGESVFGVSAAVLPSDQPGILGGAFFGICRRAREEARVWETDHGRTEHGRSSDEIGKCERGRRRK